MPKEKPARAETEPARSHHLGAVDEWMEEVDHQHGRVDSETSEWAARVVEAWDERRRGPATGVG